MILYNFCRQTGKLEWDWDRRLGQIDTETEPETCTETEYWYQRLGLRLGLTMETGSETQTGDWYCRLRLETGTEVCD